MKREKSISELRNDIVGVKVHIQTLRETTCIYDLNYEEKMCQAEFYEKIQLPILIAQLEKLEQEEVSKSNRQTNIPRTSKVRAY